MKTHTHGIYKNLDGDTVFNSQAATLIFLCGIAFKLSAAPQMLSEEFGSSAFWVFLCYSLIDSALCLLVLLFSKRNGDALLTATNNALYRAICLVIAVFLTAKGVFHFCYCTSYLTHELFEGLEPSLIYLLFLLPIVYLGAKGIRSISRSAEILFAVVFLMLALNLVFLNTKMDFSRVLPILSKEPSEIAVGFPRYGIWMCDWLPFAFIRIKNKKLPYITVSVAGTFVLINLIMLLGVAIYGDALKTVTDLLIRIAGFNQLSRDIGRTEWGNLLLVITTSIMSLAFSYFGAITACKRATKTSLPAKIAYPVSIILAIMLVPSSQIVTDFAVQRCGYFLFGIAICLPILLHITLIAERRRYPSVQKLLDEEYSAQGRKNTSGDGSMLSGFKQNKSTSTTV